LSLASIKDLPMRRHSMDSARGEAASPSRRAALLLIFFLWYQRAVTQRHAQKLTAEGGK
jgi:hypothetical protein